MEPDARWPPGVGRTVVVCDDTESIRCLLRINLELWGYAVAEAADGGAALELLEQRARSGDLPAVVILDSQMHPHDGWWAIHRIREDPLLRDIPVVMATGSLGHHDRLQAVAAGFDAFIGKPFDPERVLELVAGFAAAGRSFRPPEHA